MGEPELTTTENVIRDRFADPLTNHEYIQGVLRSNVARLVRVFKKEHLAPSDFRTLHIALDDLETRVSFLRFEINRLERESASS